uniref:Uncharacterized protein n=1 Tax=uncultured Nocardioidaceae bacterium TaxID=253824 RepID=A0A6J4MK61_9ACTN|nr:MAG: hypothetical protein AVDCRST_MAG46-3347 [uncultured Nocardioidaceae bacterium]
MPDRPENVDEAFARLVAGFHAPTERSANPWPEAENVSDDGDEVPDDDLQTPAVTTPPVAARESGVDRLDTDATWEDEGHFVPPDPPPIPRPAPIRLAAWLAVLVGPVLMTVVAALGWQVPALVTTGLVVGFVSGVVYLIATMGDGPRDPYGPDNGAVV